MGIDKNSKKYLQRANIRTHTQISYDSKGVIIRGYDATTDDIKESANRKYVTNSQLAAIQNISGINTGDQDLSNLLVKTNNLSDLTDVNTARINLNLGSLATQSGTFSGISSGTNTGDHAVNTRYERLVSNATHSGDAVGSTAITVLGINGVLLSSLGTGILKLTTGIPNIAIASDFPILNQNTTGTAANGIPSGGTAGQVLAKINGTDYNTHWITGGGGGGSGDALTTDPLSQFAATTKAQLNSVISDGTPMYIGDAPTAHTHVIADITDFIDNSVDWDTAFDRTGQTLEMLSTGLHEGGALSINADPTKFDISAGSGVIVNHSTSPPTYIEVSWGAFTGQTVTNLATQFNTDIAINSAGGIVQQVSFSTEDVRSLIFLGGIDHNNQTTISDTFSVTIPTKAVGLSLRDLARAVGDINIDGNVYFANGANLSINKSSGAVFSYGRNFLNNVDAPHQLATASDTLVEFGYVYNNGSGFGTFTTSTTVINPGQYDNGTGTLATVPTNNWTIQRILFFPNANKTFVQYGTTIYSKEADALDAVPRAQFIALAGIKSAMVRGYLIVKKGETNLTTGATFLSADRFGNVASQSLGLAATLDSLTDTTITANTAGEILKWNGTEWVNNTLVEAGIPAISHTHVEADIIDFGTYSTDIHANITALNLVSGTNTGNQTSIVGITGTKAEFNTSVTDGDILYTNDITGTPDGTKFLRDDFSWVVPPSSGSKSINSISINTNAGGTSGTDYYYLCDGTITLTLPTAIGNTSKYTIKNVGTGVITIDTSLSQLIDEWEQVTISFKNNSLDIISDGTNYRIT